MLQALNESDTRQLALHARRRLMGFGLSEVPEDDLVHDAFQAVLAGTIHRSQGRHPKAAHLRDRGTFLRYLRGVINSLAEAIYRHQNGTRFVSLGELTFDQTDTLIGLTNRISPADLAGFNLFAAQFFRRLNARTPPRLVPLVNAWESGFRWLDQIPLVGRPRKDRVRVRRLALEVMGEMRELPNQMHDTDRPFQSEKKI